MLLRAPAHLRAESDYAEYLSESIKEVGNQNRNLCQTKRIMGVKVLNLAVLMGLAAAKPGHNVRALGLGPMQSTPPTRPIQGNGGENFH